MCAGHVAAMLAAAAAAAAAPAGAAESELEDSSLFWQATLIAAAALPAAADASLLEPLETMAQQLPEVSFFCRRWQLYLAELTANTAPPACTV